MEFVIGILAVLLVVAFVIWANNKTARAKAPGLTSKEFSMFTANMRKGDNKAALQTITKSQERQREEFKAQTGWDIKDYIAEIGLGKQIAWSDIVNHAFRVLSFDRHGTIITANDQVKPTSNTEPYGYLIVESPILNVRARLPICHRDDFWLAASVFDEPKGAPLVISEELLVTYSPKHVLSKGLAAGNDHVLHYALVPRGTLGAYYSENDDLHFGKPDPVKLFGPFVYNGKIRVHVNPELLNRPNS